MQAAFTSLLFRANSSLGSSQVRRSNLLNELINHLTPKELENIAVTRVFRVLLAEEMGSGVMSIYYFDIAMYIALMTSFTVLTLELKFADSVQDAYKEQIGLATASLSIVLYFLVRARSPSSSPCIRWDSPTCGSVTAGITSSSPPLWVPSGSYCMFTWATQKTSCCWLAWCRCSTG